MKKIALILCLFLLPALACSATTLAEGLVPSGGVLYKDYFDNPNSGWGQLNGDVGESDYVNGAYHIFTQQPNTNLWTHPGKDFSNVRIDVSILSLSGPLENRMGTICRLVNDRNYYFFVISADGYYGIGKMRAGQVIMLTNDMLPHDAILTGNQINQVTAECSGKTLTLYVNNTLAGSVEDSDLKSGDIGILAGSFSQPGADVYFDNFIVTKP